MTTSMERALADACAWLEGTGRRWYLFGAHAVAVYGVPRQTRDIDVTLDCPPVELPSVLDDLERHALRSRSADPLAFAARYHVLPLVHELTTIPVDVILAGTPGEVQALARAVRVRYLGQDVPIIPLETLVIGKLASERERDVEDARVVVRVRADELDAEAVREGLRERELIFDRSDLVRTFDDWLERYRSR